MGEASAHDHGGSRARCVGRRDAGHVAASFLQPEEQLIAHLRAGDATLIVLDNCEHIIDTIASSRPPSVSVSSPAFAVLASQSASCLACPCEHVWRVASLSAPKSGEVVSVRPVSSRLTPSPCSSTRARYSPVPTSSSTIARHRTSQTICSAARPASLLAIELAAARRSLPIDRLADGLDHASVFNGWSRIFGPSPDAPVDRFEHDILAPHRSSARAGCSVARRGSTSMPPKPSRPAYVQLT